MQFSNVIPTILSILIHVATNYGFNDGSKNCNQTKCWEATSSGLLLHWDSMIRLRVTQNNFQTI